METDDSDRVQRSESSKELRARARQFRREPTATEERLWQVLRNRRFLGLKFRRQRPVGPFIADFLCMQQRLIIEVDGGVHATAEVQAHDALRNTWLQSRGYTVLHLPAELIHTDLPRALERIADTLDHLARPGRVPGAKSTHS